MVFFWGFWPGFGDVEKDSCLKLSEEPWNASLSPLTNVVVGGGLVETFAFLATPPPENQAGRRLGFNQADA